MPRLPESWLQELLDKNDIVSVIEQYVPLTRRGNTLWAACPWHADRKPSFSVTPSKQMFYCYSCKKGGSVIQFIMEMEKLSFMEAVGLLAERAGMELPELKDDDGYQQRKEYRKRLHGMMRELALHFVENLKTPGGRRAQEYMSGRGAGAMLRPFGLGYAQDRFDDTVGFLEGRGYTRQEMLDAGVVREKDGRIYDAFRGRVMFPIQNMYGDVIGFGGRVLDDGDPKYLNSGETVIFNKRYHLYALNKVKKQRGLKSILLVEGYMDVVALAGAGIQSAVASLGTSLTKEQARLLKRFTREVYLCYDGDEPGLKSALRAVDILEAEGLAVRVMVLPDGMDPDEFVRSRGAKAFYKVAKDSFPGTRFKLWMLRRGFDMSDPDQAVAYATQAVELVGALDNDLEKERYVRFLAEETGLSQESLNAQMGREAAPAYTLPQKSANLRQTPGDEEPRLLSVLLEAPALVERLPEIGEESFSHELYKKIFLQLKDQIKRGILPSYAEIISGFSSQKGEEMSQLLQAEVPEGVEDREDYARRLLGQVEIARLQRQRQALLEEASGMSGEDRREKLRQVSEIDRQIHGKKQGSRRG